MNAQKKKKTVISQLKAAKDFLLHDIWQEQLKQKKGRKQFLIQQLRIFILTVRGFNEDKIQLRASALTFYSMLSVVPVVAMTLAIAKGFGFDDRMQELARNFEGQQVVFEYVMDFANRMLENYKGGFMATIGILVLFWSVIKVLGNIENSFNHIWQIKKSRNFARKFSDYLSITLIAPILALLSSSITVYISAKFESLSGNFTLIEYLGPFIFLLLQFIPYVLIWGLFSALYAIMPNTKVSFKYALIAGILAGTMFQLLQWGYIRGQVFLSKYNVIYGSFAALPLFLIWLQASWLIVLFGAEISFAYQNVENYEFENVSKNINPHNKRILTFSVAHKIIKNFENGEPALTAYELSHQLEVPIRLMLDILYELTESNIIVEVSTSNPKENKYQPALDINKISFDLIVKRIEELGSDALTIQKTAEIENIISLQKEFDEAVSKISSTKLVKDV